MTLKADSEITCNWYVRMKYRHTVIALSTVCRARIEQNWFFFFSRCWFTSFVVAIVIFNETFLCYEMHQIVIIAFSSYHHPFIPATQPILHTFSTLCVPNICQPKCKRILFWAIPFRSRSFFCFGWLLCCMAIVSRLNSKCNTLPCIVNTS